MRTLGRDVSPRWTIAAALLGVACASLPPGTQQPPRTPAADGVTLTDDALSAAGTPAGREPVMPPRAAMLAGFLPFGSIGLDSFRLRYPTFDGRGVIIGILDSGVDAGVAGLLRTTTGRPKLLDLRDFSGEGRIALQAVRVSRGDTIRVGSRLLSGFGRFARIAAAPYYVGEFRERALGAGPSADVNGNGQDADVFPVIVGKASSGWVVVSDTDGDDALDDERPVHDFAVRGETMTYRAAPNAPSPGPMTLAVNLVEEDRRPVLDFFFDNSSHGTHVAGIAAGRNMFGVAGFDGVAPGAQVLGLKISNNGRGVVSVTGSMLRAMNYAAAYAEARNLPLVLNMSFGVGNEIEGSAAIDSIVNEFALKHPDVVFVISAGNDGPGISSVWFPGSADFALSVCALFPGVFAEPPEPGVPSAPDVVGWWSARGGEVAKPDLCAPGVAFSHVPPWRTGEEVSIGTSMAAPQIAGAAAVLQSAVGRRGVTARAIDIIRALTNTATVPDGATRLDVGAGVPNLSAAYAWLLAAHQAGVYSIRALPDGGNTSSASAAYRRSGLSSPADTVQRFRVTSVSGQPAARLLLESDVDWLHAPASVELSGEPVTVTVTYDAAVLRGPGLHTGTVWARAASDTFAGPSFGLTNTVIVPRELSSPFRTRRELPAGRAARYFFTVPDHAGGLRVRLQLTDERQQGTLYLFEPNGQPHRGERNVAVGGPEPAAGSIQVFAEDVVPGVYEAVVVAPPTGALSYELTAALPEITVAEIGPAGRAIVRNTGARTAAAAVSRRLAGAVRVAEVTGRGSAPELVVVNAPAWAAEMVLDIQLTAASWHAISDFGVTIFDSTGAKRSDGSLGYAFDRHRVLLDSMTVPGALTLELSPAFAHLAPPHETWSATLTVVFLRAEALDLPAADGAPAVDVRLAPGAGQEVLFGPIPEAWQPPPGFEPLVEVTASAAAAPSVRRGSAGVGDPR